MVLHRENNYAEFGVEDALKGSYEKNEDVAVKAAAASIRDSVFDKVEDVFHKLGLGHSPDRDALKKLQGLNVDGLMEIEAMPNSKIVAVKPKGEAEKIFNKATVWLHRLEYKQGVAHGIYAAMDDVSGKVLKLDLTRGTQTASLS